VVKVKPRRGGAARDRRRGKRWGTGRDDGGVWRSPWTRVGAHKHTCSKSAPLRQPSCQIRNRSIHDVSSIVVSPGGASPAASPAAPLGPIARLKQLALQPLSILTREEATSSSLPRSSAYRLMTHPEVYYVENDQDFADTIARVIINAQVEIERLASATGKHQERRLGMEDEQTGRTYLRIHFVCEPGQFATRTIEGELADVAERALAGQ
jgi:hypothetical protein